MKQTLHTLILAISCLFLFHAAQAQFRENISSIGGSFDDKVIKVLHDKDDNRYVLGVIGMPSSVPSYNDYIGEVIDYGNLQKQVDNGFIAKYNKSNECVWVRECPKSIRSTYADFTIDPAGNVYVTGSSAYQGYFLEKWDTEGNVIWQKNYQPKPWGKQKITTSSLSVDEQGNIYMIGISDGSPVDDITFNFTPTETLSHQSYVAKLGPDGKAIWFKTLAAKNFWYDNVLIDSQGNVIASAGFTDTISIDGYTFINDTPPTEYGKVSNRLITKRDSNGNIIWARYYPLRVDVPYKMVLDEDDNIYLTIPSHYGNPKPVTIDGVVVDRKKDSLIKLDGNGTIQWSIDIKDYYGNLLYANQSIYLAGTFYGEYTLQNKVINVEPNDSNEIFLARVSLDGEAISLKSYGGQHNQVYPTLSYMPNQKEIVLGGTFYERLNNNDKFLLSKGSGDIFIAQLIDTLNAEPNVKVSGRVFNDENANCAFEAIDKGLGNKLLKLEPGSQYVSTDENGYYAFSIPYGTYTLTPQPSPISKSTVSSSCIESIQITADSTRQQISNLDFGYNIKECALLTVDIAADRRRRCFRSKTTVTYTNEGTADAQNVKVKVLYPKYVVPISSEVPWAAKLDSALVFDIGLVRAGERKSFVITDSTICGNESIRGLSQCVQAFITPKSSCIVPNKNWAYASVAVAGSFTDEEQTANFTIANHGTGDMSDSTSYRLFANAALIKQGRVKLRQGEQTMLELPAQLATYRLEADQVPYHPGKSRPTVSLQPSSLPAGPSAVVLTPIDAFYQDDADVDTDVSCLNIIDSYDPNDKQVSPQGITKRKYIKAEDELEYMIRFQNTGTDVAYNVVVKDTISEHLDISSLRAGAASHAYTYAVSGKGKPVVTFTFKNINLPDDKADEPGSHGYIKFTIAQNPDNPDGTVIRNTAYNYFDYNSPIATNEVVNVIGDTILTSPVLMVVYECGKDQPTPSQAGTAIQLCETNYTTLQANQPKKGKGQWKLLSGQATIVNPESPTTALQDIGYGETVLEWAITLCEVSSRSQVRVIRSAIPPAPRTTVPPLQCEGDQLLPLSAEGSNIMWYSDATMQHKVFEGNNFIPEVSATTTFYATQTISGCESPVSVAVVRIHPKEAVVTVDKDMLIAPKADSYQWFFEDQLLEGETDQKLLARNTGNYRVITFTNGCESQSKNVLHVVLLPSSVLKLSPNPVHDNLMVEFAANVTGEAIITVRDQLGRQVLRFNIQKKHTVLELSLYMGELTPSMYFLDIQIKQELCKAKFVKL